MWVAEEDEPVVDQNREIDPTPLASVLGEATRRGGDSREADIRLPDNHGKAGCLSPRLRKSVALLPVSLPVAVLGGRFSI
jgi:hypothetical protein